MNESYNFARFSPTICLTHNCNLDCLYCYQEHDNQSRMTLEQAIKTIDWIFDNVPPSLNGIDIGFIGGEPLLEFELITKIVSYTIKNKQNNDFVFYATTNGTLLSNKMKQWFTENKDVFILGLSLDGAKETHDHNRSNSFDKIDIDFFVKNWPNQSIKMTLSEFSLPRLAENIKFIHNCNFKEIGGVNLFEGNFDWSSDKYIKILIPQLKELSDFYIENDHLKLDQMLNKKLEICEVSNKRKQKWCGIGDGAICFDVDGQKYPCPLVTPMSFNSIDLGKIKKIDFREIDNFVDNFCYENCYIYPICPNCPGANYLNTKSLNKHDKGKCKIQKLIVLFSAEIQGQRILKNPSKYSKTELFYKIYAIKKIKELLIPEFKQYTEMF